MRRTASFFVLLIILGVVVIGPLVVRTDPLTTHPEDQFLPPGLRYPFGTDLLGRDVFSRVIYGGRSTLAVAALATLLAAGAGLLLGGIAGIAPAAVDRGLMMLFNALLAIPGFVVALVVLTLMGRGTLPQVVALGISQVAAAAYVTRTTIHTIRSAGYIDASASLGATRAHLLWFHIVPNSMPTLLAYAGVVFSYMLLNGAALSFLGLGNEPGSPDWGVMLAEGRAAFRSAPWIGAAPGLAITLTVWAVNDLADRIARLAQ